MPAFSNANLRGLPVLPEGFDLEDQLSQTPHARVWKAISPKGETVALKTAPKDDRVLKRFEREIVALRTAEGFHTMPVLDSDDTFSWYSMPLAKQTLLEKAVPTSSQESMEILRAIAEALRPIHDLGQVHRDLKPQNILWLDDTRGARWVVADFGVVRNQPGETTSQLTRQGHLLGTEGWAAPELHRNAHDATPQADVFGAATVVSWLLTGELPSIGHVALPTDPRIRAELRRATAQNPANRHQTIDDLLRGLESAAVPKTIKIAALIGSREHKELAGHILGHPEQLKDTVEHLPALSSSEIQAWYATDPGGLLDSVGYLLQSVHDDFSDLSYNDIDRLLIWCLEPLEVVLTSGNFDEAEILGIALFTAIADIHQFAPGRQALDWMDRLDDKEQGVVESALYASSGVAFFRSLASTRFKTRRTSRLVLDLMD